MPTLDRSGAGAGLLARRVERTFTFDFAGPLPAVWAAMADTARYNEASGLPAHEVVSLPGPDGEIRFVAQARMGRFALEWEDLPCNWVAERWFEHRRRFTRGPLRSLDARLELAPAPDGGSGCRGRYVLAVEPSGIAGRLLLAGGFMASAERGFLRLAAQADEFALAQRETPFDLEPPGLARVARERAPRLGREIDASPYGHGGLGGRLACHVLEAGEVDLQRIRPLALARSWRVPGRHAIEACLQATRAGLLELRWDLLCPRCQGAKATNRGLDGLPTGAHCPTCNIDYGRDFSANVELSFRPAEVLRPVSAGQFCLLGPMSTPHIRVHVTLEPGEERLVDAPLLPPGPYRLRTLEAGPEVEVRHEDGIAGFPALELLDGEVRAGAPSPPGKIALRNLSGRRRTAVVEERAWLADALTADRATALQAFRDLFSDQVLRPGDEVAIRRVTLLFSDLRGSTALYDAVGDAAAYRLVRDHFAYLAGIVREHEGSVVKTIGDAVMAAFHDPAQGLAAAVAMQERVAAFNVGSAQPIVLKLGLHEGPCIAVTLNDRLDYFGGAVNMAARLQDQSRGGDIVVSGALADDPDAAALVRRLAPERETARLRGIAEPIAFVRLRPRAAAAAAPTRPSPEPATAAM